MSDDRTKRFLALLKEEIEDNLGSIQYLVQSYDRKFKGGEITNYVYSENGAFLAQETAGLKKFLCFLDSISPEGKTAEDVVLLVKEAVKQKSREYEDPEAVYGIINRKLEKSLRFFTGQTIS
ncbi:MAG: hypothetical protein LBQ44_00750 [Treponema sp.]|jgi:hypothetical protein|nr:hypothetical protein [Treponema sp.]